LGFAFSPFVANAITPQGSDHKAGYLSSSAISQFATNAKGRPGEFARFADNSQTNPPASAPAAPETPMG
jgi:hypothetical protein